MTPRRWLAMIGVSLFVGACASEPQRRAMVITNARVLDGSGGPSRSVSVRVLKDRIVTVGDFETTSEDEVVDAKGLVLAPGFIDTHSHHDHGLFEMPEALAAVSQGITTIVAGQDGGQQYPLAEFFARLESSPSALNVASYAGHGTLREIVMGEDYRRPATDTEVTEMGELLRQEMRSGALGLSSGLEYDPGSFSAPEEMVALATVAASEGGRYISHIRSEDQFFWDAVDEVIEIGRRAQLPVQVSHIKLAMTRWWGQADRLLTELEEARASGVDITADLYPYRAWNASFSWLATLFPDRDLSRREGADYILRDMLSAEGILLPSYLPEPAYNGKTIAEIATMRGLDAETTLMELLKADVEAGGRSPMLGSAMDEPDIEAILSWPWTVLGSDGELEGPHPRGYGSFTRFLGHYVRDRQVVTLEEAVRKITQGAADAVGISQRGAIEEGHYADLVLFDPEQITDLATAEAPHEPSLGIEKVWVNGEVVFESGRTTGRRSGRALRRSRP